MQHRSGLMRSAHFCRTPFLRVGVHSASSRIVQCAAQRATGKGAVAIDCEFVGVPHANPDLKHSRPEANRLCSVAVVDRQGRVLYHSLANPGPGVCDYRTAIHGLTQEQLEAAPPLELVQAQVAAIVNGRVVVGLGVRQDLRVLGLKKHPVRLVCDLKDLPCFSEVRGLKAMAKTFLARDIQEGHHTAEEDAVATMDLFIYFEKNQQKAAVDSAALKIAAGVAAVL